MNFTAVVRFSRHGEYENSETFHGVEIPDDTKEDDEVEAIMDAIRPEIQEMYDGDDDFEDGNISWELFEWNKE